MRRQQRAINRGGLILAACMALLVMLGCGSSQPAISKGSVKLIEKLRAAVVAKKMDWLEATAKQIENARQQGKLPDDEYAAVEPIITDARQGDWDRAKIGLTRFIDAQHGR